MKKPNLRMMGAAVAAWNAANKIGAPVSYRNDSGKAELTKTRSSAEILSGHSAVIWLDDVRGCVLLDRVNAIEDGGR